MCILYYRCVSSIIGVYPQLQACIHYYRCVFSIISLYPQLQVCNVYPQLQVSKMCMLYYRCVFSIISLYPQLSFVCNRGFSSAFNLHPLLPLLLFSCQSSINVVFRCRSVSSVTRGRLKSNIFSFLSKFLCATSNTQAKTVREACKHFYVQCTQDNF